MCQDPPCPKQCTKGSFVRVTKTALVSQAHGTFMVVVTSVRLQSTGRGSNRYPVTPHTRLDPRDAHISACDPLDNSPSLQVRKRSRRKDANPGLPDFKTPSQLVSVFLVQL